MQCQTLGNVRAAMLVQTSTTTHHILAKWPTVEVDSTLLRSAIQPVIAKRRLHLQPLDLNQYLLGQPLIIEGEQWGILICVVELSDKTLLPALLKSLRAGQFWLQFIVQLAEGHTALTNASSVEKDGLQQNLGETQAQPLGRDNVNAALAQVNASLLKENTLEETCITLVNLLAGFFQATRVSLGLLDAKKNVQLEAVSFSAIVDRRTQAMLALREAMAEAADQAVRIDCVATVKDVPADNAPSLIKQAHQHLLNTQQLQRISSILLRKNDRIIGVITIELDRPGLNADEELLIQQVAHSAAAIILLQQQVASGVWQNLKRRTVMRMQKWFEESWRAKLIAAAVMLFAVVLFVPVDYHLSADASLQTTEKYLVVSPHDGYLGNISARPGDSVQKGTVLAQLNDEDLRLERRKVASQAQQYRQTYDSALANSNRVEAAIASAQLDQATIQLQLIDQQLLRTQLISPVDGIVVSDDISQTRGAPVKQGDLLFEIAAGNEYRVHLFVDERDVAIVKPGQAGELKLTSLPVDVFITQVKLITPISEVREGRNYFRVELSLNTPPEKIATLRPGMTGTGKLNTGKRLLGWIWFHDVWNWLRLSLW